MALSVASCTPELGETEEAPLDRSLSASAEKEAARSELDVLLDSKYPPIVGQVCFVTGAPSRGQQAVDGLVAMRRPDLLKRALAAPSPEGRLYAMIGLARLGALTWSRLEARAATEAEVEVCSGCIVERVPASNALGYYRGYASNLDE
jgi:hypothetical protein